MIPGRYEPGRAVKEEKAAHEHDIEMGRVVDPFAIPFVEAIVSIQSDD
jgi:hypothetical protein